MSVTFTCLPFPDWRDEFTYLTVTLITAGEAAGRMGRMEQAEEFLLKALALEPGNPKIHNNLGNVAFFRQDFLTAIRYWEESKDLDPANTSVLFNLGLGYEKLGETEKAMLYYRLFSQKAPPELEKMKQSAVRKIKALETR